MSEQPLLAQVAALIDDLRREMRLLRESVTSHSKPLLTVDEIAELTGRAPFTVRRWIKDGLIHADRVHGTGPRGRLLIQREEIEKLIRLGRGDATRPASI